MKNRRLSNLLKILVSLGALAWVLTRIPVATVAEAAVGADFGLLLVAYLLFNLGLLVRAGRWLILLRGSGSQVSFFRLVELYFVGSFFNSFLPSGFGGDVVRAAEVTRDVEAGAAIGTVIVDRLTGMLVLFAMGLLALPASSKLLPPEMIWQVAAVAAAGLVAGLLFLHGGLLRRMSPVLERLLPTRLAALISPAGDGPAGRVHRAVTGCGWRAVAGALGASVFFNTLLVSWWILAGRALGIVLSPAAYVTFIPILSLTLIVPSIGGLGVREGLAPLLFSSAGVPAAQAVALSLVIFALNRGTGLVGGLVYLVGNLRKLRGGSDV
ncbi:MAG: flippase-like domain-containing protein [Anaerolineales bacterium]|nr:flippase-like domain-containing protein [Anaerolineales bacterium]